MQGDRLVRRGLQARADLHQPHRLHRDAPPRRARRLAAARCGPGPGGDRERNRGRRPLPGPDGGRAALPGEAGAHPRAAGGRRAAGGGASLGLTDVAPFDIEKKVLGLPVVPPNALVRRTVLDFTDEVRATRPRPAADSVAALAGALGAALASMVANLTHGKEGTEDRDPELARIAEEAQQIKDELVAAVDADSAGVSAFMEASGCRRATPEEKASAAARCRRG